MDSATGGAVFTSATPSDRRASANMRRDLRRYGLDVMTTRQASPRRRANAGLSVWRAGGTAVYGARDIPPEVSGVGREVISILLKTPAKPGYWRVFRGARLGEIDAALVQLTPIVSNLCESDDGRPALANPRNDGIIGSGAVWALGKHGPRAS